MTALLLYSARGAPYPYSVVVDSSGNIYTTGRFQGKAGNEKSTSTRVRYRFLTPNGDYTRSCRSWTRLGPCGPRVSAVAIDESVQWRSIRRATSTPLGISGIRGLRPRSRNQPHRSSYSHVCCVEVGLVWKLGVGQELRICCFIQSGEAMWSTFRTTSTSPGVSAVRLTSTQVQAPPTSPRPTIAKHSC